MQFISKIWNWRSEITEKNYVGHPIFYRVIAGSREIIIEQSQLKFKRADQEPLLYFVSTNKQSVTQFYATIHIGLQLKSFANKDNEGTVFYCFEWEPEKQQMTYNDFTFGCSFKNQQEANNFSKIVVGIVSELNEGKKSKIKSLKQIPSYMDIEFQPEKVKNKNRINDILIQLAQNEDTKMANSCTLSEVKNNRNHLILGYAVFAIRTTDQFKYSFFVYNSDNQVQIQKQITKSMSYQINANKGEVTWVDYHQKTSKVFKIVFDKYEVAMNVQFAIAQCLFQTNNKKKLRTSLQQQHKQYPQPIKMEQQPLHYLRSGRKLVTMMEEQPTSILNSLNLIQSPPSHQKNRSAIKNFDKQSKNNRLIFQAKATNRAFICSGEQIDVIKVQKQEQIKTLSVNQIVGVYGHKITPKKIIMHDLDSKAAILDNEGNLTYTDIVKFKTIQQLTPSKVIRDLCPQSKLAQLENYNYFIGVTNNSIVTIDPRNKKGQAQTIKHYASSQSFQNLSVRQDSSFAVGSKNGEIRLYNHKQPQTAANKYAGLGDPVLHMQSTKDGKWLLATFQEYILLMPTHTNEGGDFYCSNTHQIQRPVPRKLVIKSQHLQYSSAPKLKLVNAKFDQSKSNSQKFIISGFGEYIVVWSFKNVIAGKCNYTFSKTSSIVTDVEFKFDDNKKILTATSKDVHVDHNRLK